MLGLRGPQKNSLANRVRLAVNALVEQGEECSTTNISIKAKAMNRAEHKKVLNALCDMTKTGELRRERRAVYAIGNRKRPTEKRLIMWRLLRMRHAVSIDELADLAEVHRGYASEWLRTLMKNEVVRLTRGKYRLIKDTVDMPAFDDNAKRLRELRARKKKAAQAALDVADNALAKARAAINEL